MNRLKNYRTKAKISQQNLSDLLGVNQSAIVHYEAGRRTPDLKKSRTIVKILNQHGVKCTLDDVFPPNQ